MQSESNDDMLDDLVQQVNYSHQLVLSFFAV